MVSINEKMTLHMLHDLEVNVGELGVTVRRGIYWGSMNKGQLLELCICTRNPETHTVKGVGEFEFAKSYWFYELPAKYLELEHEKASRNYPGLLKSMRRAYGDSFSEREFVTLLCYKRIS